MVGVKKCSWTVCVECPTLNTKMADWLSGRPAEHDSLYRSLWFTSGSRSSEQYIRFYSLNNHYLHSRCLCGWSNQQDMYSQSCLECWCSWRVVHKDLAHTRWRHHHRCFRASQRDSCTCHWQGHRTWCGLCYRCSLTDSCSHAWSLDILWKKQWRNFTYFHVRFHPAFTYYHVFHTILSLQLPCSLPYCLYILPCSIPYCLYKLPCSLP